MTIVSTTAYNPTEAMDQLAMQVAKDLGLTYVERGRFSMAEIRRQFKVDTILVIKKHGPVISTPLGDYFFHLSMADLRIKNLITGKHDHMVTAMALDTGMTVLDCTVGLASDAIISSFIAGPSGMVVGLESSPLLAFIAEYGLQHHIGETEAITQAMRRIHIIQSDYFTYLSTLPTNSYDIVYFDPMFRTPIQSSSNLKPIRCLADQRPITEEAIREACRIARNRVILKEANRSNEFLRLGFEHFVGGKHSSVQFGIIDKVNIWKE